MARVELVLTDTRLWARSDSTHWDGVPSVAPASDGASLVTGAPLRAGSPAVSVVELLDAGRIAFPAPALPSAPVDGLAVVFGTALAGLRLPGPCEQLTVCCPTGWGERRRAVVEAAGLRVAGRVRFETLAGRATALYPDPGQQQRILVLEVSALSTTATLVGRSRDETWLAACEFEPNLGAAELTEPAVAALVSRLLGGLTPNYVLAVGLSDPEQLEVVRLAISGTCGVPIDVRPLLLSDLIHAVGRKRAATDRSTGDASGDSGVGRSVHSAGSVLASARSSLDVPVPVGPGGSLRDQARWSRKHGPGRSGGEPDSPDPRRGSDRIAAGYGYGGAVVHGTGGQGSRRSLVRWAVAAVVLVAVVAVGAVGAVLLGHRGAAAAKGGGTPASSVSGGDTERTAGRVQFPVPAGWQVGSSTVDRVELQPGGAAHERITLTQTVLKPGATLDDVANSLTEQLREQPAGQVSELDRAAVFAERPGMSYQQFQSGGTTVFWHVIVDQGLQVSVGCRYPNEQWPRISATCEKIVAGLKIAPQ